MRGELPFLLRFRWETLHRLNTLRKNDPIENSFQMCNRYAVVGQRHMLRLRLSYSRHHLTSVKHARATMDHKIVLAQIVRVNLFPKRCQCTSLPLLCSSTFAESFTSNIFCQRNVRTCFSNQHARWRLQLIDNLCTFHKILNITLFALPLGQKTKSVATLADIACWRCRTLANR